MNQDQGLTLYPASQSSSSANLLSQSLPAQVVASSNDAFGGMGAVAQQSVGFTGLTGGSGAQDIAKLAENDYDVPDGESAGVPRLGGRAPVVGDGEMTAELFFNLLKAEIHGHNGANAQSSGKNNLPASALPATSTGIPGFGKYQMATTLAAGVPAYPSTSAVTNQTPGFSTGGLTSFAPARRPYVSPYGPSPGNGNFDFSLGNVSTRTVGHTPTLQPSTPNNEQQVPPSSTRRTKSPSKALPEVPVSRSNSRALTSASQLLSSLPASKPATNVPHGQLSGSGSGPMPVPAGAILGSNGPLIASSAPGYSIPTICRKLITSSQECSYFAALLNRSLSRGQDSHKCPRELSGGPVTPSPLPRAPQPMPSHTPNGVFHAPELTPPSSSGRPLPDALLAPSYQELWDDFQNAMEQTSQCRSANNELGAMTVRLEIQLKKERDKKQRYRNERDKYMKVCGEWTAPIPPTGKTKGEVINLQVTSLNRELASVKNSKTLAVEALESETKIRQELEARLEAKDKEIKELKLALEANNRRTAVNSRRIGDNMQGSASKGNGNRFLENEYTIPSYLLPGDNGVLPQSVQTTNTPNQPKAADPPPAPAPLPAPPASAPVPAPRRPKANPRRRAAKPRGTANRNSTLDPAPAAIAYAATNPESQMSRSRLAPLQSSQAVVAIDLTSPPSTPFKPMKRKMEYSWLPSKKVQKPTPYPSDRRRSREATVAAAEGDELPAPILGSDEGEWAAFNMEFEREMMGWSGVEESLGVQGELGCGGSEVIEPRTEVGHRREPEVGPKGELSGCDVPVLSSEPSGEHDEGLEQLREREWSVDSLFGSKSELEE
ncbi:MAG: hypothetical protein M1839_009578 [Geoglossum umbratile]|nr:MAG: hypothetical protein M1839_009578 [Geoglossum umbratile]